MSPGTLFALTVAVCLMNGLVSPALPIVFALHPVWLPEVLKPSLELLFYMASLMVSTGTLLLAGVPAAVLERIRGARAPSPPAMMVWFAAALLLTLPALV